MVGSFDSYIYIYSNITPEDFDIYGDFEVESQEMVMLILLCYSITFLIIT